METKKKADELKDWTVIEVAQDIAERLNVDYEQENNEIWLNIPEEVGEGTVRALAFSHGVGILNLEVKLKKEVRFEFNQSWVQPLKIIFNRKSPFVHQFSEEEEIHEIEHLESAIISCTSRNGNVITLPANEPICLFNLELNRKLFEEKIENFLPEMNEELESLFRDVNGVNLFFYKGNYSLDIARCIEDIGDYGDTGLTKSVFVEGKCYEILAHYLKQYLDDLDSPGKRQILRKATVEKVKKAAKIINDDLNEVDNIKTLANKVGLNQNSLQNGFQKLYGASVNNYIRNARMEMGKTLIEQTDLNISEITYKIGISSRSYFSKLFKERFAMSPTQYRKKAEQKNDKSENSD
ncbi:helix-turn-helix domain-containing protein [Pareuzebyella sediminis]|uniref:helix-turn-helix domain-containing protein n=1 Tax=Pareuzebyella sediminis TaxID=2607998 RepID=UPI0011ECD0F8|nr:AraC family transcriptional regulator [Pareuzebyella sediminis]